MILLVVVTQPIFCKVDSHVTIINVPGHMILFYEGEKNCQRYIAFNSSRRLIDFLILFLHASSFSLPTKATAQLIKLVVLFFPSSIQYADRSF